MQTIYLDHAATSPLRPEVTEAMAPFLQGLVGNPSSVHRWGRAARKALDAARERVAATLGVFADEVCFVRGGTESANLAILGRAARVRDEAVTTLTFLTSPLEHSSVREAMDAAGAQGIRLERLSLDASHRLNVPSARELRSRGVGLVSCQWVNQETGLILPVPELADECAAADVPLHVDAVQAAGHLRLDLGTRPIAMLTLSGHKIGGPVGTGILVIRRGAEIRPVLHGGGQESGLRPGTEDVAGAVGVACALELVTARMPEEAGRLAGLRQTLEAGLTAAIATSRVHAGNSPRAPHILGLGIPGLARDVLPSALDLEGIGASAGSACMSGSTAVSPTLQALHGDDAARHAPLRLSLGWTTTAAEIADALRRIPPVVNRIREIEGQRTTEDASVMAGRPLAWSTSSSSESDS